MTRTEQPDAQERAWIIIVGVALVILLAVAASVAAYYAHQARDSADNVDAGVTELVNFVHDFEARNPPAAGSSTSDAVRKVEELMCTTADKVRQEACRQLGIKPVIPTG